MLSVLLYFEHMIFKHFIVLSSQFHAYLAAWELLVAVNLFLLYIKCWFVCLSQADSRSALIKVHFDQLSTCDFWCCLCSRILRQTVGSTSNLRKHLQARHPKEFASIVQIMSDDSFVKVEASDGVLLFNILNYCVGWMTHNVPSLYELFFFSNCCKPARS